MAWDNELPVAAVILDPDAVRVARISRAEFTDDESRLRFAFETEIDGEDTEVHVVMLPEESLALVTGVLDGLGFPENDIQYLRNRWRSEWA